MIDRMIGGYADAASQHPFLVLFAVMLIFGGLGYGGSYVSTVDQSTEDFLPDHIPVQQAFNFIRSEFSTAEAATFTILIQTAPSTPNSNELRDVRDPAFLRYVTALTNDLRRLDRVTSVHGPADLFDTIPASQQGVEKTLERLGVPRWGQYIADDYSAIRIEVEASGLTTAAEKQVAKEIQATVDAHQPFPGTTISYSGQPYIDQALQQESQTTTRVTTSLALLGVLAVVILLFQSAFYGLTAILTLVFGLLAGFGIWGLLGYNLSPQTSGTLSISVGIAIDFGIQPVARYLEERQQHQIRTALYNMMTGIIKPMTLGMIAAIMGFSALSFGTITFLSSLGVLLSLTTVMAYIAALVALPPIMIIYDRYIEDSLSLSILTG